MRSVNKALGAGLCLSLIAALAIAAPALGAGAKPSAKQRAAVLQAVVDCRSVKDPGDRLKCYDDAAARLDQAEAAGQVVVVDREQAKQVRTEIFGLQLPSLEIFSHSPGGKEAAAIAKGEDVDTISSTVTSAVLQGDDKWVIEIATGAVWRQIDTNRPARDPKPGMTVEIRRASVGSYLMKIAGQRSIRVHRDR